MKHKDDIIRLLKAEIKEHEKAIKDHTREADRLRKMAAKLNGGTQVRIRRKKHTRIKTKKGNTIRDVILEIFRKKVGPTHGPHATTVTSSEWVTKLVKKKLGAKITRATVTAALSSLTKSRHLMVHKDENPVVWSLPWKKPKT